MAGHAITAGSLVWVEDEQEAWTEGEVLSISGDEATVKTATAKVRNLYGRRLKFCKVVEQLTLFELHEGFTLTP